MPNRKKFNARFPPARIKKIMRTDKEVGKVAAPVPVVISRALELFAEQLLQKAGEVTLSRGSRTLSPAHLKHCILSERRFDFLKDLVEDIPDAAESEETPGSSSAASASAPAAATATSATSRPAEPPPPPPPPTEPVASAAPRSVGRPHKYLKMEIPAPAAPSTNGQSLSAPPGRPPVPGLIHTSMLGMSGGGVTAAAVPGEQFSFSAPTPHLQRSAGPSGRPPALAIRYGSQPERHQPDGV